jgi:hypothetical protein
LMLATSCRKSCASPERAQRRKILVFFRGLAATGRGDLRNFAGGCRRFRTAERLARLRDFLKLRDIEQATYLRSSNGASGANRRRASSRSICSRA